MTLLIPKYEGGQAEGFSIPAQREANKKKAQSLGAVVVKEFVERGVSGTSTNRPALKAMMRYLEEEQGNVDFIIVHKIDRLARNRADDVAINAKFDEFKVRLASTSENIDQTPGGLLMHGIMSSIAEFYSKNLANEVTKGMTQKVQSGGTAGKAPLGYLNTRNFEAGVETRTVEVDPERSPLVQWAFERYAEGDISVAELTTELNARGLTTVPTRVYPSKPVNKRYVHGMLSNKYYLGITTYCGVEYPGNHQPLISKTLFEKVGQTLNTRRQGERRRKLDHFLKSTVWCGDCGSRLILQKPTNHQGIQYEYFVCNGRMSRRTDCTMSAIPLAWLESQIEDLYRNIQVPPALLETLRPRLKEQLALHNSSRSEEFDQLKSSELSIKRKQEKLLEAYYDQALPMELMAREQKQLEHSLSQVQRKLKAFEGTEQMHDEMLERALEFAANCFSSYTKASDIQKKMLNQLFFEKVLISSKGEKRTPCPRPSQYVDSNLPH
ncbi:recombinase family protein [Corynebacterium callunae]|uniref:recombinase family protein n=1 Tax=Corynebacterium callunae TaxID=1721 RepID=UPI003982963E